VARLEARHAHRSAVDYVLGSIACNEIGVFLFACRAGDVEAQKQRLFAQSHGARMAAGQRKIVAHTHELDLRAGRVLFDNDEVSGAGRRAQLGPGPEAIAGARSADQIYEDGAPSFGQVMYAPFDPAPGAPSRRAKWVISQSHD
jgi:hypothetical protein